MKDQLKSTLRNKANEVLEGILLFLSSDDEVTFEDFEKKFPKIRGKQLGSLFSGITRTAINNKRLTISIPLFGSRRKIWKLNKDITAEEKQLLKAVIMEILEERK